MTTSKLAIDGGAPVRSTPIDTEKGLTYLNEDEEMKAVEAVLRSRSLFRYYGPDVQHTTDAFESRLKEITGCEYALGVTSGTAALQAGLVGLEVEDGDEVIVPAVTFIATVGAVVTSRAVPVFAEVDESLNLDPVSFEAQITEKTRAVIPVHLANVSCDMDPIMEIARKHGIKVLEDAAQAMGVTYHGRQVGSIGDAGAFSLQLSKNITTGEGGALVTSQFRVFDRAARFHDQGGQFTTSTGAIREHTSGEPFIGSNMRMTEIAGALAAAQIERLEGMIENMRSRAAGIRHRLSDLPVDWRKMPDPNGDGGNVTMFFETEETAIKFADALRAEGVPAGRVYGGRPVYANPAVLNRKTAWSRGCPFNCTEHPTTRTYHMGMCARSEELLGRSLSIGIGPRMTDADADDIVTAVRKVAEHVL